MNRRREILTEPKCRAKIWVWNRSLKKPIRKSGKRLEELKKARNRYVQCSETKIAEIETEVGRDGGGRAVVSIL